MIDGLVDYFPDGDQPRPQQEKILRNIEQAFNEGYKFAIVTAPTGAGKSHVAKTLGNVSGEPPKEFVRLISTNLAFKMEMGEYKYYDECMAQPPFGTVALTITKSLQDQYQDLFNDIEFMKGKSNYLCTLDDELTVDMAPCVLTKKLSEDCIGKKICPYYNARAKALTAKMCALNYKMFFSLPDHVKQREYLICDEAAELEDELVKHFTCEINFKILKKLGIEVSPLPLSEYSKYQRWAEGLLADLTERIDDLKQTKTNDKGKETRLKKWIRVLQSIRGNVQTLVETFYDSEYQVEKDEESVKFIPLKVDKLSKYLFNHGKRIVLMSATIIDVENYCKTLGIENYKYIEVDSPFDPEKAPIYCSTKYKLNFKNIDTVLPYVIEQVRELCEQHKDQKGIIHTHSNKITQAVQNEFAMESRFLYREDGVTNEHILDLHNNSKDPTVLVSPSMSHGVDLKGDLAEFQIIIKAPFMPLGDIRVKKMFEMDKIWYSNKMLCGVIQSCGRGVRSKSDECVTYILDGAITDAIRRNRSKIPGYFLDRIH
jgi:Rad3-related DNA helicase